MAACETLHCLLAPCFASGMPAPEVAICGYSSVSAGSKVSFVHRSQQIERCLVDRVSGRLEAGHCTGLARTVFPDMLAEASQQGAPPSGVPSG